MAYSVKVSDLSNMSASDADGVLDELVSSAKAPRNGQLAVLNARIREFEQKYERSTETMRNQLAHGQLKETADISRWLFWLAVRDERARK